MLTDLINISKKYLSKLSSWKSRGNNVLSEGEKIPGFKILNQNGEEISSKNIADNSLIYFYPKASTPGCTKQACNIRDSIKRLEELGLQVYGVSTDSVEDQKDFHSSQDLNFDLLADENKELSEKFGVLRKLGFAERTSFVVREGVVVKVFRKVDPEEHLDQVIDYLKE